MKLLAEGFRALLVGLSTAWLLPLSLDFSRASQSQKRETDREMERACYIFCLNSESLTIKLILFYRLIQRPKPRSHSVGGCGAPGGDHWRYLAGAATATVSEPQRLNLASLVLQMLQEAVYLEDTGAEMPTQQGPR